MEHGGYETLGADYALTLRHIPKERGSQTNRVQLMFVFLLLTGLSEINLSTLCFLLGISRC
jgi:hypothetical protein